MGRLRILTQGIEPDVLELPTGVNTLGRRGENNLCLPESSVSGRHCELSENDGVLTIRDLGSTNGSFIGSARVEQGTVAPGEPFRLGNIELIYEADAPAPVAAPAAAIKVKPRLGPRPPEPSAHTSISPAPKAASSLALHRPAAAPPAPETPPAAPPLDPCPRHKSNAAKYVCTKCQTRACDDCVKNFSATENKKRFCPVCSGKCVTLDEWKKTEGEKLARESMTFRARLPGVFKYPFSKGGALLLIVGTILYLFLDFAAMFSWKLAILAGGYLFAYMQKIVCASAFGEEHLPDWPEFGEWWEDIARPFFMLVWTFVVSFGPAFGYMIYNVASDSEMMLAVLFPLFALGFLYFPMALLAVAMSNSFLAVNPLVVLPAITRLNLEYVAATAVFFGLVLARYLCETLLHRFVPVPILPTLVSGFLALYFLSAEMRLLGLMYYANRERLGWYRN